MGGTLADGQRDIFMERLSRIERGGPNTVSTVHVGPAETDGTKVKVRRKRKNLSLASMGRWLFMLLLAGIVGFASMLAGRVATFHLLATDDIELPLPADQIALYTDIGIAFLLMTLFGWAFQWGGLQRVLLSAGFLAVMLGEGLMMREAPVVFEALYTPEYVAEAVATGEGTDPLGDLTELAARVGL